MTNGAVRDLQRVRAAIDRMSKAECRVIALCQWREFQWNTSVRL